MIIGAPRKGSTYKASFGMAFVSERNVQVCGSTSCRDYLHDTIRTFLNNKTRTGADGHPYYPKLGDPDLCMDKLRLLIEIGSKEKDSEKRMNRALKMINILEDLGEIQKTTMSVVDLEKMQNKKGINFLFEGSKEYMYNPHLLSLLTLIIRFMYHNNIEVTDENSLFNSHINAGKDKLLMESCHDIIHLILKNRKELFKDVEVKDLFPTSIGYSFHSQGGIQSLCSMKTPNTVVNERVTALRKALSKKKN